MVGGGEGKELFDLLSDREFEIFLLLVDGNDSAGIAKALNLSPKTVSNHQYNINRKLRLTSRAELTRLAFPYGLLQQ